MRQSYLFLMLFLALSLTLMDPSVFNQVAPRYAYHYVLILDTSGSMSGKCKGCKDILPDVKNAVNRFVDSLILSDLPEAPTQVFVYTFDTGIQTRMQYQINSETDRQRVRAQIMSVKADGENTYIYSSFHQTLREIRSELESLPILQPNEHVVSYYLFTDGDDNCPSGPSFSEVINEFRLTRNSQDFIYYCKQGIAFTAEESRVIDPNRDVIRPLTSLESPWQVVIKPTLLHLGNLWGKTQASQEVNLEWINKNPSSQNQVQLKLDVPSLSERNPSTFIDVTPSQLASGGNQTLQFTLHNPPEELNKLFQNEEFEGKLSIVCSDPWGHSSPSIIPVRFLYAPPCTVQVGPLPEDLAFSLNVDEMWSSTSSVPAQVRLPFCKNISAKGRPIGLNISISPTDIDDTSSTAWKYFSRTCRLFDKQTSEAYIEAIGDSLRIEVFPDRAVDNDIELDLSLTLSSPHATIVCGDRSSTQEPQKAIIIPTRLSIPGKPMPLWQKILTYAGLGILGIVTAFSAYSMLIRGESPLDSLGSMTGTKPLHGQIIDTSTGDVVDLASRKGRVALGRDGTILNDFDGKATMYQEAGEVVLEVSEGSIMRHNAVTNMDDLVYREVLKDGDILRIGNKKFKYSTDISNYS